MSALTLSNEEKEILDEAMRIGVLNGQGETTLELYLEGQAAWEEMEVELNGELPAWYNHDRLVEALKQETAVRQGDQ